MSFKDILRCAFTVSYVAMEFNTSKKKKEINEKVLKIIQFQSSLVSFRGTRHSFDSLVYWLSEHDALEALL